MAKSLILSRGKLADFGACRRRFQLRYLERLSWPAGPLAGEAEEARRRGQRFHQILHRHFLGLPVDEEVAAEPEMLSWWRRFLEQGPPLPAGRRFPEVTLTVPAGDHLLTGRFDLLILGEGWAHIYDWKTEAKPRPEGKLREDLQTQIYLALATEGMAALGQAVPPEQVSLTYWFVNQPAASVTLDYDQARHERQWAGLVEDIAEVDRQLASDSIWPLTDDLRACERCAYPLYCGRSINSLDLREWEPAPELSQLEPETP